MRALSLWFAGVGLVQVGHVSVRLLVAMLPARLQVHEAPIWSVTLVGVSAWGHLRVARGLRERQGWARAVAVALAAAWTVAAYVEVNSASGDVGTSFPVAIRDGKVVEEVQSSHVAAAGSASWQAAGWPAIVAHPYDYVLAPTGAWAFAEWAFVVLQTALGVAVLAALRSKASAPIPAPDPADARSIARHALAALREDAQRTPATRALGFAVAAHLAFLGVVTAFGLVTLSIRVIGGSMRAASVAGPAVLASATPCLRAGRCDAP